MDISLKNTEYCSLKRTYEATVEECVEAELSLPEYMPEILRIVKSQAIPKINSCTIVGERVTVDGVCELRMIYVGNDNAIYSFSQTKSFTRYAENPAFLNVEDVKAKALVNFVNCRATNTKRAEIKAGVAISICAFQKNIEKILMIDEEGCIEEKKMELSVMSLGCKKSKMFSMSDTFLLENETAAFLIRASAAAVLGETRKISNKIMLKGETIVEIAFVPNEDKSIIRKIRRVLPINQILEFDGMEEHFIGDILLDVAGVDVIIKNDSQGEGRSLDVAVSINAGITMWEEKEVSVITDAYSLNGSIDLSCKKMKFYSQLDSIKDTYIHKASIDVKNTGVESVLDAWCELTEPTLAFKNGHFSVVGSIKATMLLKDTAGSVVVTEKMLDYSYERKTDCADVHTDSQPQVTVSSFECVVKNKEQIDVRAEMQINCFVFNETEIDVVNEFVDCEGKEKRNNSAITVYFPENEESLWDIAKRYNTTVKSIALENNLEGDTTGEIKMLFIPSA